MLPYPAEVERVLLVDPKVAEAAVIGVPHPKWGEVACAFVVLHGGAELSGDELVSFLRRQNREVQVPKSIVFVSEPPRTSSGKVRKQELKKHALEDGQLVVSDFPPVSAA